MQSCCIFDCDSYKSIINKRISYFKFPEQDSDLLEKWLTAINQPHWKPGMHTQICEVHFKPNDIERPLFKYPYLKPDAVPAIFPQRKTVPRPVNIKQSKQTNTSIVENDKKSEITLLSPVLQATPVILTPSLIEQIPVMNQNLSPSSNISPRFRKILPKLEQNNTDSQKIQIKREKSSPNSTNPYIIIIPTFDNAKSSVTTRTTRKLPSKSSKKPILKITVGRRLREDECSLPSKRNNNGTGVNIKTEINKNKINEDNVNNKSEEIVIDNYSLKKSVVYTLDAISGKIKVSHRPLSTCTPQLNSKASDSNSETSKRVTRSSTKENKTNAEIISKFKKSFLQTQQDHDELMKKKFMMLRPVHEADEIEKLEKELLRYGNSVNNESKINNKVQENKRVRSCSPEEKKYSNNKVFILESLLKNNEVVIKKMKTPLLTNGQVFITKSLPSKKLNISCSKNVDKNNHSLISNSANAVKSTRKISNNVISKNCVV